MKASDLPLIEEKYYKLRKLQSEAVRVFLEKRQERVKDHTADLILANALRDSDAFEDVFWLTSEVRRLREALVACSTAECGHCDRGVTENAHEIAKKALEG